MDDLITVKVNFTYHTENRDYYFQEWFDVLKDYDIQEIDEAIQDYISEVSYCFANGEDEEVEDWTIHSISLVPSDIREG